jgi:hypothetical protein
MFGHTRYRVATVPHQVRYRQEEPVSKCLAPLEVTGSHKTRYPVLLSGHVRALGRRHRPAFGSIALHTWRAEVHLTGRLVLCSAYRGGHSTSITVYVSLSDG